MMKLEDITAMCRLTDKGYLAQPVTCWRDKETGEMVSIKNTCPAELFAKIVEEAAEAMKDEAVYEIRRGTGYNEVAEDHRHALGMELTDIITACTTALDYFGFDLMARAEMQNEVNTKNRNRGYHNGDE